jgi:hypothetical protein
LAGPPTGAGDPADVLLQEAVAEPAAVGEPAGPDPAAEAMRLYRAGQYAESTPWFDRALQANPEDEVLITHRLLARELMQRDQRLEANRGDFVVQAADHDRARLLVRVVAHLAEREDRHLTHTGMGITGRCHQFGHVLPSLGVSQRHRCLGAHADVCVLAECADQRFQRWSSGLLERQVTEVPDRRLSHRGLG